MSRARLLAIFDGVSASSLSAYCSSNAERCPMKNVGFVLLAAVGAAASSNTLLYQLPWLPFAAPRESTCTTRSQGPERHRVAARHKCNEHHETSSDDERQATYGAAYRSYDYFTAKHYAACVDARGNGAHYGPHFATWHAALGLEFERALRAVDPAIEALPYWDASETSPSVFGGAYFGSAPGLGDDYDVIDGPFGSWRVPRHKSLADYAPNSSTFSASTAVAGNSAGYLRHPHSMTSVVGVLSASAATTL